ncbi:MAG: hypothetical protein ABI243_13220, partial [Lapillicoccus sp.]
MPTAPTTPSLMETETGTRTPRVRASLRRTEIILAGLSLVAFVVLAITTGGNLVEPGTLRAVFQFLAVPMVIGLSQMVVLAVGQMNLSVGVLTGLTAVSAAGLMVESGWPAWLAVLAALLIGLIVGLVNGLLVVVTRINGFIVTLATMTIISGVRYGVNGTDTYQGYSDGLVSLGRASVLGVPTVFLAAVVVAVLVAVFFARSV